MQEIQIYQQTIHAPKMPDYHRNASSLTCFTTTFLNAIYSSSIRGKNFEKSFESEIRVVAGKRAACSDRWSAVNRRATMGAWKCLCIRIRRRRERARWYAVVSDDFAMSASSSGAPGATPVTATPLPRLVDYFLVCGLDIESGLEPDRLAGESPLNVEEFNFQYYFACSKSYLIVYCRISGSFSCANVFFLFTFNCLNFGNVTISVLILLFIFIL